MLLLRQAENYQETVANPCWPTGYRKSLSLSSIYDSPCTEKERPGLPLNTTVVVSGTGNGNLCAVHVNKLFDFTSCSFSHCSFDGVFQPEVSGNFIVSPSSEQGGGLAVWRAQVSHGSKAGLQLCQGVCLCPPQWLQQLSMVQEFAPSLSYSCFHSSIRPSLPSSTRWTSSAQ